MSREEIGDAAATSVDVAVLGALDGVPVNAVPDVVERMRALDAVRPRTASGGSTSSTAW
jgi:methylmalonyl-CoA mutase cobalamin-binding subunit